MTKPKPPTPDGQLQPAKQALTNAISDLIDPRPQRLNNHTHWLDPRYHELRDALTSQRIGAHSPGRSQPPAWLAAIDLLRKIDHRAHELEPATPIRECDDYPAVQRLRTVAIRTWEPQDTELITKIASDLATYTRDIDQLFAQPPKYLPNNCPRCDHSTALKQLDGETVRTPALQITDSGCTCNHCHAHWPPDRLMFLGNLLGYRIQGVIGG